MLSVRGKGILLLSLGLWFAYCFLAGDNFIYRFIFLVLVLLDFSCGVSMIALYNYDKGYYSWQKKDSD